MGIFGKLLGTENPVKAAKTIIDQINSLESKFESFSHEQLKEQTKKWRDMLAGKEWDEQKKNLEEILPEAFAAVREAAKRTLKQRHFDVQLLGGIALYYGGIAEMRTGEGKTLVATLPAYLKALEGRGVHIVTVNDYLSRRDATWMGQVYAYLGL